MNLLEKILKISTGTYQADSTSNINAAYFNYFASTSSSMTKDQLVTFNSQLSEMGLNKPPEIDNTIQNFSQIDLDQNGSLTYEEINKYLASKGYNTPTATVASNKSLFESIATLLYKGTSYRS